MRNAPVSLWCALVLTGGLTLAAVVRAADPLVTAGGASAAAPTGSPPTPAESEATPKPPPPPYLSPEESVKLVQLPPGYHLELVLSEPVIREPVLSVFDGNGRLYVAEMRSFMQDADATNEKARIS